MSAAILVSIVAALSSLDHALALDQELRVGGCYAPGAKLPENERKSHFLAGEDFATTGRKWPGSGPVVTYSFATAPYSLEAETGDPNDVVVPLDAFMPAGYKAEIARAFDAWSAVANIRFVEVPDNSAAFNDPSASGDIRIGGHAFDGAFGVLAHAFFPDSRFNAAGDIHFDIDEFWEFGLDGLSDGAFDVFLVALHEIGHSIGLDHSIVLDAIMAPFYDEDVGRLGLRQDDIDGAVSLYGRALPIRTTTVAQAVGRELKFCTSEGFLFSGSCVTKKRATGNQRVTIQTNLNYKRFATRDGCSLQASLIVDGRTVWKSELETLQHNSVNGVALVDLVDGDHDASIVVKLRHCRGVKFALGDQAIIATKIADVDEIEIDGEASQVIVGSSSSSSN